jgi:phospholipase/lecithinase/hemolysin
MLLCKKTPMSLTAILSATAIAPLVVLQSFMPAEAADFSQIYAFGDSLVDTGNAFAQTGIPPAPYFEGRFSNGPLWTEYLASDLGIAETSLGFVGALSNEIGGIQFGNSPLIPVPGTLSQVNQFVANPAQVDPNALYVIWAGANDYLFTQQTNPLEPVGNLTKAVTSLSQAGAKDFLVVNLPDLGNLPLAAVQGASPEAIAGLNALSNGHNQALEAAVAGLNSTGNIKVNLLEVDDLFRSAIAGNLGFNNVTDACTRNPVCVSDPDVQKGYLFWDEVHPTTTTGRILADSALALIKPDPVSVPEPAVVMSLIFVGALGLHQLKRNRPAALTSLQSRSYR